MTERQQAYVEHIAALDQHDVYDSFCSMLIGIREA